MWIGDGTASARAPAVLLKSAPDLCDITVLGAEPHPTATASC